MLAKVCEKNFVSRFNLFTAKKQNISQTNFADEKAIFRQKNNHIQK